MHLCVTFSDSRIKSSVLKKKTKTELREKNRLLKQELSERYRVYKKLILKKKKRITEKDKCNQELNNANVVQEEFRTLSDHDPLTKVFNRRAFVNELNIAIQDHTIHKYPITLLYIDLDRFKQINDVYGHRIGDLAIIHLATFLTTQLHGSDRVGRLGGDEFAVLLSYCNVSQGKLRATILSNQLTTTVVETGDINKLHISGTFGVAEYKNGTVEDWISFADADLLRQKRLR